MKIANNKSDFVNFSARYIIDGKKEELDIVDKRIQSKKNTYKAISKFSVCYNKEKQMYMNLYATDSDCYSLAKAKISSEFLPTFRNSKGTLLDKFKHLAQFVFGTTKDINVIKAKDIIQWDQCSSFHPATGAVNHKTIQQLDGLTISYNSFGEVFAREIVEDGENGVKRIYCISGADKYLKREEYIDGSYRTYNSNGSLIEEKNADGLISTYNSIGGVLSQKDADGNITRFYESGKISSEEKIDGSSKKYLPNGKISKEINSSGLETRFLYRKGGENLLFKMSSDGNICFYDEDGNQDDNVEIKKLNNGLISVIHDSGVVLTYDNQSNLISKLDSDGTLYEYGGKNNSAISSIVDPDGTRTEYFLNKTKGEKIKSISGIDGSYIRFFFHPSVAPYAEQYSADGTGRTYCNDGRLLAETLSDGTRTEYYPNGQIHRIYFKDEELESYRLDGSPIIIRKKNGESKRYDVDGKVCYYRDESGNQEFYFPNGQLSTKISIDGSKVKYSKDGILLEELSSDGTFKTYNQDGKILLLSSPQKGVTSWTYNKDGELITKKLSNGTIEKYKNGELWEEISSDGVITKYHLPSSVIASGYSSFTAKLAWSLSPNTKEVLSNIAKSDKYLLSIIRKNEQYKDFLNAVKNGADISSLEKPEISGKEYITYLSYIKDSWAIAGREEFSKAKKYAHKIYLTMLEEGIDGITDPEIRKCILEWKEENPVKYEQLFGKQNKM